MSPQLRVLLVEDVLIAQNVATKILQKLGHKVDVASDGGEAVHLFEKKNYDLIFMDIALPTQDGFETTRQIRELESDEFHTPIVALSANYDQSYKAACLNVGMDEFLSKPLTKEKVLTIVQRFF